MSEFREKEKVRREILALRRGLSAEEIDAASKRASALLLASPEFASIRAVLFYAALPEEVQTREAIEKALATGKRVFLPRIGGRGLRVFEIKSYEKDTREGAFHIPEPHGRCPEASPRVLDLAVVPGVAFDTAGRRIGFGKGYYDCFLGNLAPEACIVGLAFESQVVDGLPSTENDRGMDMIVTEKRIIRCRNLQS